MLEQFSSQRIDNKQDFLKFLEQLIKYFNEHQNEWENVTLPDYLGAAQQWTEDMEGYYMNKKLPMPENINWQVFADILIAATMYE